LRCVSLDAAFIKSLQGKEIGVVGTVKIYKGKPEIELFFQALLNATGASFSGAMLAVFARFARCAVVVACAFAGKSGVMSGSVSSFIPSI
jgi:hypothetical protein